MDSDGWFRSTSRATHLLAQKLLDRDHQWRTAEDNRGRKPCAASNWLDHHCGDRKIRDLSRSKVLWRFCRQSAPMCGLGTTPPTTVNDSGRINISVNRQPFSILMEPTIPSPVLPTRLQHRFGQIQFRSTTRALSSIPASLHQRPPSA